MRLIPDWVNCSLEELLIALESGSRPRGGVRGIENGVPSIGGEHLTYDGTFDFSSIKYVPEEFAKYISKGHVKPNDIHIVKDGATTGKTAFVGESFPYENAVVNEHVFICRPSESIEPRFLFRYLISKEGQERILSNFQGSAQGGINLSFASNTEVPLAPLNEQRRIVAKLEKLLSKVDACKERLDKIPIILKRFRQSVLSAACSGRLTADWRKQQLKIEPISQRSKPLLTETGFLIPDGNLVDLPESWMWTKLPQLGYLSRGKSRHRPRDAAHLYGGKYPFIQTCDIAQSGGRITSHRQTYNEAGLAQSKLWPEGTVCITIAANIADSAILTYPACFPDSVVGFIAHREICLPEYVEFFIRTARKDLSQFAPATAQKNINVAILNDVIVPQAPLPEQQEIVRRVEGLFKIADGIEERYKKAKVYVDKLTQSILSKAFRGELVPQDTNDEPASVLLERIREERNKRQDKSQTGKTKNHRRQRRQNQLRMDI